IWRGLQPLRETEEVLAPEHLPHEALHSRPDLTPLVILALGLPKRFQFRQSHTVGHRSLKSVFDLLLLRESRGPLLSPCVPFHRAHLAISMCIPWRWNWRRAV